MEYAKFIECNAKTIKWLTEHPQPDNYSTTDIEHIIDFLKSKDFEALEWASWDLLKEKAAKWVKMLTQNVSTIDEEYGTDIDIVLDFQDGYRWVKLISQNAYTREGGLMSHCVGSYFTRKVEIFSLRDAMNKPHCTIEKDEQIKGKGNGDINLKYINYVVKFLEHIGMKVRDSEMQRLGYIVPYFPEYVTNKLYLNKYIAEKESVEYVDTVIVFYNLKEACSYRGEKKVLFACHADFSGSQVTDLGSLTAIGGDASFSGSQVKDLGSLTTIGKDAFFRNSKVEDLRNLTTIGGYAYFDGSKVKDLGSLATIGGSASFTGSEMKDLKNLVAIGGNAYFENSNIKDLKNLTTIGGDAWFKYSKVTDLKNLTTIGRDARFRDSKVKDLKKLTTIGGSASFEDSEITRKMVADSSLKVAGRIYYYEN